MPNVFDCVADIVAARAGREMFVAVRGVFVAGVRDVVAVRDMFVVRLGRDVVVVCAREVVVVRCGVLVARDVVVREDVVREATVLCEVREMLFASRTAASAMPTPTMYAIRKVKILFIPCI